MSALPDTIKTAVVGYGYSAQTFHIPFLMAQLAYDLVAISSSQTAAIEKAMPGMAVFKSAEVMIEQAGADLLIITAPNDVHYSLIKHALLNDMHVVVEKPFVTRSKDGEELIKLAEERGKILTVYHNRRWDGDFLTIKKLIKNNTLGKIRYFESHFDRFRMDVRDRWRETAANGGGLLYDLGSHLLDQALQLFGPPEAISATCKTMRPGGTTTDLAHITLHYADMLAVLHMSVFSAGPNRRFQVQGELGTYEKYGLDPQEDRLKAGMKPVPKEWADEEPKHYGTLYRTDSTETLPTERGGYQQFFSLMKDAILHKGLAPVAAKDALMTIKLIELAAKSSETGKTLRL
ncbi:oxidoreductase [Kordiimonas pumila]|uniref:Oxidoreductase n=1 Tax=Kordiimonas pumila TaxID=2161677 RepID=A0ABV7D4E6_9PROT|nr:oxidoreductase [Kordiimonas pumila]